MLDEFYNIEKQIFGIQNAINSNKLATIYYESLTDYCE